MHRLLLIALIRLSTEPRAPTAWDTANRALATLRASDEEELTSWQAAERELTSFLSGLRDELSTTPLSKDAARALAEKLFSFLDLQAVARAITTYSVGDNLVIACEAFAEHLAACTTGATTWSECLAAFEGHDQIPLMTVHKSKGLEYDTILFVGLDDKMWWSYSPDNPEGLATFFVGLSRAKQRAIFSYCRSRGQRVRISGLYNLLTAAGVPELTFEDSLLESLLSEGF